MRTNKLNIFILLTFLFVMVFLIFAQVDYILGGLFKNYLLPLIIGSIICYIVVFGIDLYERLKLYKLFSKVVVISVAVINFIVFIATITLLPILIHYNLSTNLIAAIHSAAITVYAVISGFSVIILNRYYPKKIS